ncbi:hypothetical protein CDB3_30635 [Bacillus sp. CDB3]|nr:hypothetical protein CDB3_30635 [Bacillus sp. CDB3]
MNNFGIEDCKIFIEGVAKLINIQKLMHKEIRLLGKMIVSQTTFGKEGFTSIITDFDENQSIWFCYKFNSIILE